MYTRRSPPPPPCQYRSSAGRVISRIASRRRSESSTRLRAAPFSLPPTSIRPCRHQFSFQATCCTYVGCCTYSGSTLHAKKLFHQIRYDEHCHQIQSRKKDQDEYLVPLAGIVYDHPSKSPLIDFAWDNFKGSFVIYRDSLKKGAGTCYVTLVTLLCVTTDGR